MRVKSEGGEEPEEPRSKVPQFSLAEWAKMNASVVKVLEKADVTGISEGFEDAIGDCGLSVRNLEGLKADGCVVSVGNSKNGLSNLRITCIAIFECEV